MWRKRPPRTVGDDLWNYVSGLRRGEDEPQDELLALRPVAQLVSEALKGRGGEGPQHLSEARLLAEIARSEERRWMPARRNWALPAFAVAGWTLALFAATLAAWQNGVEQGTQAQLAFLREVRNRPAPVVAVAPPAPVIHQTLPKHHPKAVVRKPAKPTPPTPVLPPSVRSDELPALSDDFTGVIAAAPSNSKVQDELLEEAKQMLVKGEWEKAADGFEQVAKSNPDDETALDALHMSGRIAERALNDPQRAGDLYRREAQLARQIIDRRGGKNDAPSQPARQRLARALTSGGLLERNPRMLRQADEASANSPAPSPAEIPGN